MATYEKIDGLISLASNSPNSPTGYGTQTKYLVEKFTRHGIDTAVLSNHGFEAEIGEIKTPYGKAKHYPKGYVQHSVDVIPTYTAHHRAGKETKPHALLTLYDVWIYNHLKYDGPIWSWTPIDHDTIPPAVKAFLERPNVHPITMAPHGQRLLEARGIRSTYIPHSIDTTVFRPSSPTAVKKIRARLGVGDDTLLAIMVAANKSNGSYSRKGFFENVAAFAAFHNEVPNSKLYLHTDPRPVMGGIDFAQMFETLGLTEDDVLTADGDELMVGLPQKTLTDIYSAADVMLAASYGEGFGVPIMEAQACGTPVITSNWTAPQDLAGPESYLVEGQVFWNQSQGAYFKIPNIIHIYSTLKHVYEKWDGPTVAEKNVEFAKEFDTEVVWQNYWMPFLRDNLK